MKLYLSNSHSEEDDDTPVQEGVYGMIYSSKDDLLQLCDFFAEVKEHLQDDDKCHMHFRDSFSDWKKGKHVDIEVNTIN